MAKILTGQVVSTKMQKTLVIQIERKFRHPVYKKIIKRNKKYKVHHEGERQYKAGDIVTIKETRPISKDKHFIVVEDVRRPGK